MDGVAGVAFDVGVKDGGYVEGVVGVGEVDEAFVGVGDVGGVGGAGDGVGEVVVLVGVVVAGGDFGEGLCEG